MDSTLCNSTQLISNTSTQVVSELMDTLMPILRPLYSNFEIMSIFQGNSLGPYELLVK